MTIPLRLTERLHAVPVQRAFTHAFEEVFGLRDLSIDVITHHGLTDPLVAQRTLVFAGIGAEDAEARWPEVAASVRALVMHIA